MEELVYATLIADLIVKVLLVVSLTATIVWIVKEIITNKKKNEEVTRLKNINDSLEKWKGHA